MLQVTLIYKAPAKQTSSSLPLFIDYNGWPIIFERSVYKFIYSVPPPPATLGLLHPLPPTHEGGGGGVRGWRQERGKRVRGACLMSIPLPLLPPPSHASFSFRPIFRQAYFHVGIFSIRPIFMYAYFHVGLFLQAYLNIGIFSCKPIFMLAYFHVGIFSVDLHS